MAGSTNFPGSLDSHTSASPTGFGEVVNLTYTTFDGAHSIGATTLTVVSTTGFPTKGYLILSESTHTVVPEVVSYTGTTGTTFTGVSALTKNWASGDRVSIGIVAAHHNDLAAGIVAAETKLGTGSSTPSANTVLRGTGAGTSAYGQIVNADVSNSAAIADSKLGTISTANKVDLAALDIDSGVDIGTDIADADLLIIDDGGAGTNRKTAATRIAKYTLSKATGDVTFNTSNVAAIAANVIVDGDIANNADIVETKIKKGSNNTVLTTGSGGTVAWGTVTAAMLTAGTSTLIKIGESVLGAAAATVDFTSIPATYRHLLMVANLRGDDAGAQVEVLMRLNNDSGSNYDWNTIAGSSGTASHSETLATTRFNLPNMPAAGSTANKSATAFCVFPMYAGTTFHKTGLLLGQRVLGTSAGDFGLSMRGWVWRNTAAIDRITLSTSAGNFDAGSAVTLYGLPA